MTVALVDILCRKLYNISNIIYKVMEEGSVNKQCNNHVTGQHKQVDSNVNS